MGDLGVKKSFTLTACDNSLEKYFLFLNFQRKNFLLKIFVKNWKLRNRNSFFRFRVRILEKNDHETIFGLSWQNHFAWTSFNPWDIGRNFNFFIDILLIYNSVPGRVLEIHSLFLIPIFCTGRGWRIRKKYSCRQNFRGRHCSGNDSAGGRRLLHFSLRLQSSQGNLNFQLVFPRFGCL